MTGFPARPDDKLQPKKQELLLENKPTNKEETIIDRERERDLKLLASFW